MTSNSADGLAVITFTLFAMQQLQVTKSKLAPASTGLPSTQEPRSTSNCASPTWSLSDYESNDETKNPKKFFEKGDYIKHEDYPIFAEQLQQEAFNRVFMDWLVDDKLELRYAPLSELDEIMPHYRLRCDTCFEKIIEARGMRCVRTAEDPFMDEADLVERCSLCDRLVLKCHLC